MFSCILNTVMGGLDFCTRGLIDIVKPCGSMQDLA